MTDERKVPVSSACDSCPYDGVWVGVIDDGCGVEVFVARTQENLLRTVLDHLSEEWPESLPPPVVQEGEHLRIPSDLDVCMGLLSLWQDYQRENDLGWAMICYEKLEKPEQKEGRLVLHPVSQDVAFVNAQDMAQKYPETFEAPSQADLQALKEGDVVKVCPENGSERFWSIIRRIERSGGTITSIVAEVDNELINTEVHGLKLGDEIRFAPENIYSIYER